MDKQIDKMLKARNKFVSVIFLVMIGFVLILALLGIFVQKTEYSAAAQKDVWIASTFYPLENYNAEQETPSFFSNVLEKTEEIEVKIEEKVTSAFYFRIPFVMIKRMSDKMAGMDMTTSLCAGENDLNDSTDIVLPYEGDCLGYVMDDADISEKIENIVAFGKQMTDEGRDFLFVLNPEKVTESEVYLNYFTVREEEIKCSFEENGLDLFFISDIIEQENTELTELFFKTDHHWLPSAGIWADGILCKELNERYGYSFDASVFDMENYETTILENYFLGSQGRKITEVYCEKEDFPIILPKYDTDLSVFISGKNETCDGSIADTLMDYSVLENNDTYFSSAYLFYGYNDQALISIHNNAISNGSHILMIKTSFADCMYPYLSTVVEDLDVIDLRLFDGSLQSYISETNPDTVVVIYSLTLFEDYAIDGSIFDFR